ncbi:MAG: rod shape-determining protein MreD [Pseudobutyrivibrio sp.]|nr:rod shape-determining protein MreD [Pseudobutyrivibrio sp.]
MRRVLISAMIIITCFLLQTNIFSKLPMANVTPNIIICVVSAFGFMKGQKKGLMIGFLCGLLLDFYGGSYLGINAFIYMIIGYINGFFKRLFFGEDLRLPLILIGISDIIYGFLVYVLLYLSRKRFSLKQYFSNIMVPELVYTLLVSIFIYFLILKISGWLDNIDKRGNRRLDGKI